MDQLLNNGTEILRKLLLSNTDYINIPEIYLKYFQFLPLFLIFFALAFLLKPIIGRIAFKIDAVDYPPDMRKLKLNKYDQTAGVKVLHKSPTPLLGGVGVLIPLIIALPFFFGLDSLVAPFILAAIVLLIVGILDDTYNLPAHVQLGGQVVAALIIALSTFDIPFINNPLGGVINLNWFEYGFSTLDIAWRIILPGDLIVIAWIILCTNAVKWVGGIGGLLESNMIVAYSLMFILGVRGESMFIATTAIIMAGGIAGGWIFDLPPAKIFSGSTGKTLFGFIIATLAIVNGAKVAATILILALPLIDAMYVLVYRYSTFKPKSLIELMRINGPMHFHHQLFNMNFSPPQILLVETSISIFFGIIAVLTTGAFKFVALLLAVLIILIGIILLNFKSRKNAINKAKESEQETPESKYSY